MKELGDGSDSICNIIATFDTDVLGLGAIKDSQDIGYILAQEILGGRFGKFNNSGKVSNCVYIFFCKCFAFVTPKLS